MTFLLVMILLMFGQMMAARFTPPSCPIEEGECMCGHHGPKYVPVSDTCAEGCMYKNDNNNLAWKKAKKKCAPNELVRWDSDECLDDIKHWLSCENYDDSIIFWTGMKVTGTNKRYALHRKSNSEVVLKTFKQKVHKPFICMAPCDFDDCESSPCFNDATCVDAIYDYTCICQDGFTGHDCETDINECESDPCQNGGTCIDAVNSYSCICLPGYTGTDCETECIGEMDLIFIVDTSGSVDNAEWAQTQTFLIEVIKALDINSGKVRVGIVTFSAECQVAAQLDYAIQDRDKLIDLIPDLQRDQLNTNHYCALEEARALFEIAKGDRVNVTNVILLITDGVSTEQEDMTDTAVDNVKNDSRNIFAIVAAIGVGTPWMEELASAGADGVIDVTDYASIITMIDEILQSFCDL